MDLTLPAAIAAMTAPTKTDVPAIDAWAKSVHPDIAVTFDEERAAPPRRITGPHRGESVEQARARDPGPACLTVRVVELRTGQKTQRRVHIHRAPPTGDTAILARVELAAMLAIHQEQLSKHTLSDVVLLSGVTPELLASDDATAVDEARKAVWDYPDLTAKHHDLLGQLCPESVVNAKYVEREKRIFELREIIKGDWKTSLVEAVTIARDLAIAETGAGRAQKVALKSAMERARAPK